jgi:hypothetical protein
VSAERPSAAGASKPEPRFSEGEAPHPEALREIGALLDMARGLAPDLAARASYELDVLVGRLERAETALLREVLSATYTPEGVDAWLAAKKLGFEEKLSKAQSLKGMVAT